MSIQVIENFTDEKERGQFYKLYHDYIENNPKLGENGYFFGSVGISAGTGGVKALDAILITNNFVLGLEFKNYGDDDRSLEITPSSWKILTSTGEQEYCNGEPLVVKGGSRENGTPLAQAQANHGTLTRKILQLKGLPNDEFKEWENKIPYAIVFNKPLRVIRVTCKLPDWLIVKDIDRLDFSSDFAPWLTSPRFTVEELETFRKSTGMIRRDNDLLKEAQNLYEHGQYQAALKMIERFNDNGSLILRIKCNIKLFKLQKYNLALRDIALRDIVKAEGKGIPEAWYWDGIMLRDRLSKSERRDAKGCFLEAQRRGCELADRELARIYREEEQENNAQICREKKAAIEEATMCHNLHTRLMIQVFWLTILLYIAGNVLNYFDFRLDLAGYIMSVSFFVPYIVLVVFALNEKDFASDAKELLWNRLNEPEISQEMMTCYESKSQMISHKIWVLVLQAIIFVLLYLLLKWIGNLDAIHDYKYLPLRQIFAFATKWYAVFASCMCLLWIIRVYFHIRDYSVMEYPCGMNSCSQLLKYWARLGRYLIKLCFILSVLTVIPNTIVGKIKEYRNNPVEKTERIDGNKTVASEKDNKDNPVDHTTRKGTRANTATTKSQTSHGKSKNDPSRHTKQNYEIEKVVFDTPIMFAFGKYTQFVNTYAVEEELHKFSGILEANPTFNVILSGSIEQEERQEGLHDLAWKRANYVRALFREWGVQDSQIEIEQSDELKRDLSIYLKVPKNWVP